MKSVFIAITFLFGQFAFSHGEGKLGPHNGYIRMPGAFHTEVVPDGMAQFKVYLLDIEWKNPSIRDSKLEVRISDKEKTVSAKCDQRSNHYECSLPNGFSLDKGRLFLRAVRENSQGAEVPYDLPLSLVVGSDVDPHKGHH